MIYKAYNKLRIKNKTKGLSLIQYKTQSFSA
ncbi:IS3 family transposase [Tissierella praeacuta]